MRELNAVERQREVYLAGASGYRSKIPFDFETLELLAKRKMSAGGFGYVATGAGREATVANNRSAFERYAILPRMLRDVSVRDTSVNILEHELPSPMLISPIGVLDLASPNGDVKVARAAESLGVPMIYSNQASTPMEYLSRLMPTGHKWFQLYWSKSEDLVKSFIKRAENSGCTALVITLDTTLLGWRIRDLNNAYLPFLEGKGIAQYTSDPVFQNMLDTYVPQQAANKRITLTSIRTLLKLSKAYPGSTWRNLFSSRPLNAVRQFIGLYSNPAIGWPQIQKALEWTDLPILLKGILTPEDASKAQDLGVAGLIISNHGGRQVDGAIASLDALPEIRRVCGPDYPLILDSGIRNGQDIFKAIALGANGVGIGRPYVYALALGGQNGVETYFKNLHADFELNMALSGCASIDQINESCIKMTS